MSNFKQATALVLAIILCLTFISCAKPGHEPTNDSSTTPSSTDTTAVTDGLIESDSEAQLELPTDLDYKNTEINIHCESKSLDLVGDVEGDIVSAAVFERNSAVENRLKVKLVMVETDGDFMNAFKTLILANDDSIDILAGCQYLCIPQARDGLYRNVADAAYINWEKPWWSDDYMDTIQWNEKRYVMIGDISLHMLHAMSAFFVNKALFEDEFGSIDNLYQEVFDGKWTWEKRSAYVSQVYRDANGNNKTDEGDILGMRGYHESPTDHMAYTAGLSLSTRDADGSIVFVEDQSRNIEIAEAMYKLMYENKGCFTSTDNATFMEHFVYSFAAGNTLFCGFNLDAADDFRNMEDEYAIITHPKFDELQEDYKTLIHDYATTFAIPTTVDDEEFDMLSAVLEAMCYESYKRVTPVYYDVVLKSRYSSDPQSAKAIDMIRENIFTDFIYANNYSFNAPLGTIMRTIIGEKNNNYSSLYKRYRRLVENDLKRFTNAED